VKVIIVAGFAWGLCLLARPAIGEDLPNPFVELAALEANVDRQTPDDWRRLMSEAQRLELPGSRRRFARELLKLEPDDAAARAALSHKKFVDATGKLVWLDWFDAALWQRRRQVRDVTLGYHLEADRDAIHKGLVRLLGPKAETKVLTPVEELDREHATWATAHEIDSRFFHFRSTAPLAAIWFVADDLDGLVQAYLDYFEIERFPQQRFTVHLYRTLEDAAAAKADVELLKKYGAYFWPPEKTLHVPFKSIGGLTAARHEAAHALNRAFVPSPPQWFDEGTGVMCQFAQAQLDGQFEFGQFPKHGFGTAYLDEVRGGARDRIASVHATRYVTMNAHYYSQFRSIVAFFMHAENQKYRMTFINAMFRKRGDVERLVSLPNIDEAWMDYARGLKINTAWRWKPHPQERNELIERVLMAGSSAAAFDKRIAEAN